MLETGRNCWRIETANRASLVVDAADYFRLARQSMLRADSQILLIGWDFDTRIDLVTEREDEGPTELGAFISWLPKRRPGLQVYILKWDVGALKLLGRGSTVLRLLSWKVNKHIHFKLDGAHPSGGSHHQKIVVIDDELAFCGGIDMTAARWDTRDHKGCDFRRRRPTTGRLYPPWHDATMAVDGAAARALGDLARERWCSAGGKPISPPSSRGDCWPGDLAPLFRNVDIAISRTRGAYKGEPSIREIEALFLDQISRAKRYVYVENQYFASRAVANAIIMRLSEPNCPEFIIVNPLTGEDWLDDEAMTPARTRLMRLIKRADKAARFHIYSPVSEDGTDIYVHSKILIVDDEIVRVGSANLNNRSMGLDSECDLTIDTTQAANHPAVKIVSAILCDLLAEHLGARDLDVQDEIHLAGSLSGAIAALAGSGRRLVPLSLAEPNAIEEALADNEILDPEGSSEDFEPPARRGLMKGIRTLIERKPRP